MEKLSGGGGQISYIAWLLSSTSEEDFLRWVENMSHITLSRPSSRHGHEIQPGRFSGNTCILYDKDYRDDFYYVSCQYNFTFVQPT